MDKAFSTRLDLICKRLNWSRARLAQRVGIDKSLAWRWLSGAVQPGANSLMRLTEAVAAELPGFTAADWDLDLETLARRHGVAPPASADAALPAERVATPLTIGDIVGSLRSVARFTADIADVAAIYAGFYRVWMASAGNTGSIWRRSARIWRHGDALRWENTGGTVTYTGGCFILDKYLYIVVENVGLGGTVVGIAYGPRQRRPTRLTGIVISSSPGVEGGVTGTPVVLEFVEPMGDDDAVNERRWQSMIIDDFDVRPEDAKQAVPPEVLAVLRPVIGVKRKDGTIDHILAVPRLS